MGTKTGLTPIELAKLTPTIEPTWSQQGSYTSATLPLPPNGGRTLQIDFSILPGVGDTIVFSVNLAAVSATYASSFANMAAAFRALPEVDACWYDASSITIMFGSGQAAVMAVTTAPSGTTITDVSPGVEVGSVLRAGVLLDFTPAQASVAGPGANIDLLFTARDKYPGAAGNSITVQFTLPGPSVALSVAVTALAINVTLETDGGGSAVSTAQEILDLLVTDGDVMALVSVAIDSGGAPGTVQAAGGPTNLASGANSQYIFRIWGLPSNRNVWHVINDMGTLARPQGMFTVGTGNSSFITEPLNYFLPVDGLERLFVEVVSMDANCTLDVRIGPCTGA